MNISFNFCLENPTVVYINFSIQTEIQKKEKKFKILKSYLDCNDENKLLIKYIENHPRSKAKKPCQNILNLWIFHQKLRTEFPDLQIKYLILTNKEHQLKREGLAELLIVKVGKNWKQI